MSKKQRAAAAFAVEEIAVGAPRPASSDVRQLEMFPGHDDRDVLLTRAEAASYLRRSTPTLENWARQGIGPRAIKQGRTIRYRLSDIRAWIEAGAQPHETE